MSIDDQRYAALTLQSLRVTIGPLQASTTSLKSRESYLTAGMLPYNRNVTLQTFLSSTRDFYRLHSTFARLYNAAASPASRLRSAGSLAIMKFHLRTVNASLRTVNSFTDRTNCMDRNDIGPRYNFNSTTKIF